MRGLLAPLVLLIVSVSINYADRGNLSIASPLLQKELAINSAQIGVLFSAFFWSYAFFQLVSGWLADRFDPNWVLLTGFVAWSVATAATGWISGFLSLFLLRLLVGVGESVAYPAYSKIFSLHYTENQRGMANALVDVGTKLGPAAATLLGGLLVASHGWQPLFWILGFGALCWVPLWIRWMPRSAPIETGRSEDGPSVWEIMRRRSAWATFAGLFSANYIWYFLLTWLPLYLVRERHFSIRLMAVIGTMPYVFTASATALAAWLSYRAIAAGATVTRVRKTCTAAGLGLATVIALVPAVSDVTLAMVILMVASIGYGVYCSSHWAITQTLAGPLASGRWTGLQNFCGNLAGVVAPMVTGFIVQRTGHFMGAFICVAAVCLFGAFVYSVMLVRVEPEVWGRPEASPDLGAPAPGLEIRP